MKKKCVKLIPTIKGKTIDEQETMQYDNDPLVKKVLNKIKSQVDYPDKPSKAGYPNDFHQHHGKWISIPIWGNKKMLTIRS